MRFNKQRTAFAALALGCILTWSAGCASTTAPPAKPAAPVHAMVDMQKLLDAHPSRAKLRQMEQELTAAEAKAADNTADMEIARQEFEAAMKIRQNEDKAALEKKQTQLGAELNEQRRLFIEALDAEYGPLIFNIDLKLKAVQQSPTETQALQKERAQLEAQGKQKLKAKEDELAARFQKDMDAYAAELTDRSEAYAKKWMQDRMQRIQKVTVSPERAKQRQEIMDLSNKMIQDVRTAVAKTAVQEKIEMVWLRPAVRLPLKDITDTVAKEIANAK